MRNFKIKYLAVIFLFIVGCTPDSDLTGKVPLQMNSIPQEYIGIWSADPKWCRFASQIGTHDPAPIRISKSFVDGLENRCTVISVDQAGPTRIRVDYSCAGEGFLYSKIEHITLSGGDTLYIAAEGGVETKFSRCK